MAEAKLVQILYYKLKWGDTRPEAHFVSASLDDDVSALREHIAVEEAIERANDIVVWKPRQPLSTSELVRQLSDTGTDGLQETCDNLTEAWRDKTVSDLFELAHQDALHSCILVAVVPGTVEVCYHVFERSEALPVIGSVVLSRDSTVGDLRRRIAAKRSVTDDDVCLWMPHEPLSRRHKDFVARLSEHNNDPDQFGRNLIEEHLDATVVDVLRRRGARDLSSTALVARIYTRPSPAHSPIRKTTRAADILAQLEQRFQRSRSKAWGSPSTSAQPDNYYEHQSSDLPILDGRHTGDKPVLALPVGLLHPVFARFTGRIRDLTLVPPKDVVAATFRFMQSVSEIDTDDARHERTMEDLTAILGMPVGKQGIVCSHPDSSAVITLAVVEEAGEWSEELGLDPAVRGEFSYIQHWTQPRQVALFEECFCPSFIISLVGPYLGVCGAVYTTDPIVERLLDRHYIARSRSISLSEVREVARMLYALRLSLFELKDWYATVHAAPEVMSIRRRIFPLATSCTLEGGEELYFRYLVPLQRTTTAVEQSCTAFLVADCADDRRRFVVKFAGQYGAAAHRFLAAHGYAPKLLYAGPVWRDDKVAQNGSGSQCMVVMEYLQGETAQDAYPSRPLPSHVTNEVRRALKLLHAEGMVHGDVHEENIMLEVGSDGGERRVKLLGFDWAGEQGVAEYPFNIELLEQAEQNEKDDKQDGKGKQDEQNEPDTQDEQNKKSNKLDKLDGKRGPPSRWPKGARVFELIEVAHDNAMLEAMSR